MENVCRFSKFGYCKYKETCRKTHFIEICKEASCVLETCLKRHPRICRFYRFYNNCKFGEFCQFSHDLKENKCGNSERINKLEKTCIDINFRLLVNDELLKKVHCEVVSLQKEAQLQKLQIEVLSDEFSTYASAVDILEGKVKDMDEEYDIRISSTKSMHTSTSEAIPQISKTLGNMQQKLMQLEAQNVELNKLTDNLRNSFCEIKKQTEAKLLVESSVHGHHLSQPPAKGRMSRFRPPP